VREREIGVELQPVRAARYARAAAAAARDSGTRMRPQAGEHLAHRLELRIRVDFLERERELAAPVGVLVDRPRHVRLLEHAEHVLRLHHENARGCIREIGIYRERELGRHRRAHRVYGIFRQQLLALDGERQPRAFLGAVDDELFAYLLGGKKIELLPDGDVFAFPETPQCG
jgi:hypothetical protein